MKNTQWTSIKNYVDIETGEQIPEIIAKTDYITIRKDKYIYGHGTHINKRITEWVSVCRRNNNPQIRIEYRYRS